MIVTARANDCQYIWNAHAAGARRQGISDAFVDALRDGQPLPEMAADEQAVINLGQEFFSTRKVSQETFQAAIDQFGAQGLTELCTLFGYYALLSFNANTFLIDLRADERGWSNAADLGGILRRAQDERGWSNVADLGGILRRAQDERVGAVLPT